MAKKRLRLKRGDIVEIIWNDTHVIDTVGWMSESQHTNWVKNAGSKVRTVGIFISESKEFVHIVGDTEYDDVDDPSYLRPINVGKGYIEEIHKLVRS